MERPYVIYHMLTTIDNKVTGYFMRKRETMVLKDYYYQMHRIFEADAFLFEETASKIHLISGQDDSIPVYFGPPISREDYVLLNHLSPWAVIIDPHGTLPWDSDVIHCNISCYNGAQLLVVLTESVSDSYLAYLRERNISYVFCGKNQLDQTMMLTKMRSQLGIRTLLLEGSISLSRQLVERDLVDELSLIVAPCIEGPEGLSAFNVNESGTANIRHYLRESTSTLSGHGLWMRYRHRSCPTPLSERLPN